MRTRANARVSIWQPTVAAIWDPTGVASSKVTSFGNPRKTQRPSPQKANQLTTHTHNPPVRNAFRQAMRFCRWTIFHKAGKTFEREENALAAINAAHRIFKAMDGTFRVHKSCYYHRDWFWPSGKSISWLNCTFMFGNLIKRNLLQQYIKDKGY